MSRMTKPRELDWNQIQRLFTNTNHETPVSDELARDLAEERAAIMEYDGGLSRADAERLAFATTSTD